jgi:hypothetical protein
MIGNQYSDTAIAQIKYYILNVVDGLRVDARERLV